MRQGGVPYAQGLGNAPTSPSSGGGLAGFMEHESSAFHGALGGILGSIFGGGASPMSKADPYLGQEEGAIGQQMDPYTQAGAASLGHMGNIFGGMVGSPGAFLNKMGQSYHQSPGFEFAMHQALMGANNAAAAGGMGGSPLAQQQNAQIAEQMANQNYYQWLGKAQGLLGTGLEGEMGVAGMGMQGATNMSNVIANKLQEQAAMAYHQQAAKNAAQGKIWGDIGDIL